MHECEDGVGGWALFASCHVMISTTVLCGAVTLSISIAGWMIVAAPHMWSSNSNTIHSTRCTRCEVADAYH